MHVAQESMDARSTVRGSDNQSTSRRAGDTAKVAQLMKEMHVGRQAEAERARQAEADLWNADPFDPEAQVRAGVCHLQFKARKAVCTKAEEGQPEEDLWIVGPL